MIELTGASLSSADLLAIAHGAKLSLAAETKECMRINAQNVPSTSTILQSKRHWLTGDLNRGKDNLARDFILGHCAGVGRPFDKLIVRGAMVARANVLATGYTGSRPIVAEKLIEMLNKDIVPTVPSQGSVGAAGVAPMAHIARVLCGYTAPIEDFEPLIPTDKEALAIINGISLSTAIAAICVERAKKVFSAALWSAALTMEVVCAQSQCLDPRVLRSRRHPEVNDVGDVLRELLTDSLRVSPNKKPDAFSIRCGPSVMGAILRTIRFSYEEVQRELNGASDNPLFIDGEWIEAGNFHGASIALAMDHLATALTQLGTLAERRIFRLTHGKLSNNLPSFLVQGTGINSGFMLAQYTAAALASEMKGLAHPASVDTIPTVQHHEDHVSMAPIAGRMAMQSIECLADIIAIELLVGAQALDLRVQDDGFSAPKKLEQLHKRIREDVRFWEDDNVLHPDIRAMATLVRQTDFFALDSI